MRRAGEPPEKSAAKGQEQRQNQQLRAGHALRAAFPVIPGQDQRDEKSDDQSERNAAAHAFRPSELLRDNVDALQKGERRCNVGHTPLHQLALLQFGEKVARVHLFAAPFSSLTFCTSA